MISSGDYVIVNLGVHDESMPKDRRDALVVELVGPQKDQAVLMFSNKIFLKFHLSQLTLLEKYEERR